MSSSSSSSSSSTDSTATANAHQNKSISESNQVAHPQQQHPDQTNLITTTAAAAAAATTTTTTTTTRTIVRSNLPLSMTFMRSLSGVAAPTPTRAESNDTACCANCKTRFTVLSDWDNASAAAAPSFLPAPLPPPTATNDSTQKEEEETTDENGTNAMDSTTTLMCLETTDFSSTATTATHQPPSAVSPLVWAPMMMTMMMTDNPSSLSQSSQYHPSLSIHHRSTITTTTTRHAQRLLSDYMTICKFYGCRENVGVLTTLRYSLPACRVSPGFGDVDMLALAELWLLHTTTSSQNNDNNATSGQGSSTTTTNGYHQYVNTANNNSNNNNNKNTSLLQHVIRLDLSMATSKATFSGSASSADASSSVWVSGKGRYHHSMGISSHGALALAKVLQQPQCALREVLLPRNKIGSYGATALFCAAATNPTLQTLGLRRCRIGHRGALAFCQLILTPPLTAMTTPSSSTTSHVCGLRAVDLSANFIGFDACHAIEKALQQRLALRLQKLKEEGGESITKTESPIPQLPYITVNLEGNLVFQEIMNGVTHGLGVVLGVVGCIMLSYRVRNKSFTHISSCAIYSTSLLVLYISSTLFHSFFCLQQTRYLFEIFDKSAIYILIAGSYTPFLQIVLQDNPMWSNYLLGFLWMCCLAGICVEAFSPTWRFKVYFSLAMYLGMGWSAVVVLPEVIDVAPTAALRMLVLGGVAYTSGVPFFVRNHNLDHSIWHLFVLTGSILHWIGIYEYVATFPYPTK